MNKDCDRVQALLAEALEGCLDEALAADVLAHGRACPECARLARFHSELLAARERGEASLTPPPVYFEGVLAELHRRLPRAGQAEPPRLRRRVSRRGLATAASWMLVGAWCFLAGHEILGGAAQAGQRGMAAGLTRLERQGFARMSQAAPRLVALEGIGFVPENSPMLKFTPAQLRDLGLMPCDPERQRRMMESFAILKAREEA
jgi:hypothetical protein